MNHEYSEYSIVSLRDKVLALCACVCLFLQSMSKGLVMGSRPGPRPHHLQPPNPSPGGWTWLSTKF